MAKIELTSTLAKASAFGSEGEILWDGDYMAYVVAMQSYRSLRRFITRHVAPHADSRIRCLLRLDAEARARTLLDDPRALDAWAVAIWSSDLERKASLRLWTQLSHPEMLDRIPQVVLDRDAMGMEFAVKAPDGPLRAAQADWLLRHATLATLRHRFARARALARGMARASDAVLGKDMLGGNSLVLTGEVLDGGDLQFTVEAEPMRGTLAPRPHQTKVQRRMAAEVLRQQRLQELMQLCTGPCLRFSWLDGWGVASSSVPNPAVGVNVKRHRLFAVGRPAFVLFATPTGWCARMADVPLEAHDDMPWKVIDTLRHAYTRYKKLQEGRAAEFAAPAADQPAEVESSQPRAEVLLATQESAHANELVDATAEGALVRVKVTQVASPVWWTVDRSDARCRSGSRAPASIRQVSGQASCAVLDGRSAASKELQDRRPLRLTEK